MAGHLDAGTYRFLRLLAEFERLDVQGRAITRVATAANESSLLSIAKNGTVSHVEKTVRLFQRGERAEELEAANAAARSLIRTGLCLSCPLLVDGGTTATDLDDRLGA